MELYNPSACNATPEPQALSMLHRATSIGPKLPDLIGSHEVHHHLGAMFN